MARHCSHCHYPNYHIVTMDTASSSIRSSHRLPWLPRSRYRCSYGVCNTCVMVCLVLLTCMFSATSGYDRKYGSMTPSDPMLVSGSTLELNCTMSEELDGENVSSIYFNHGNRHIPDQFVTVVNDRTVMLRYPNALRNIDDGHWFCRIPSDPEKPGNNTSKVLGQQYVTVADLPVKPNITGCVVYNWENMTCTWEPEKQDTGLITNQTLYWTLHPRPKNPAVKWQFYDCPILGPYWCNWTQEIGLNDRPYISPTVSYTVFAWAVNALDLTGVYSEYHRFKAINTVKPNKVKHLRVSDLGANHMDLTWITPSEHKHIIYKVRYMSARTQTWHEVNVTTQKNSVSVQLTGLTPYTRYTLNVTCMPGSGQGFWSLPSILYSKTLMSVPSAAPVIPPGGFTVSSDHHNPDKRKVDILWQSIPEPFRNGVIKRYRVRYGPQLHDVEEFAPPEAMRHTLVLDKAVTYYVTLDAATQEGYNESLTLSPLLVPKEDKLPPKPSKLVSVALEDDFVFVNWTAVKDAIGYTVYWCKGSSQFSKCDSEMKWESIDVNSTSYNVTLDSGSDSKQFIFGVSAELLWDDGESRLRRNADSPLVVSSGVLWSDCTYDIKKPVGTPKSVELSDQPKPFSISLTWDLQNCGETIYIDKYIIYYCKVVDCPADDGEEEGEGIMRVEVDSSRDDYTIEDLEPTEYRVWMRSYSSYKDGLSPPTEKKTVTVNPSGPTKAVIAVLSVLGLIVLFFIVFGLYQGYKMCQKKVKENVNVRIERPPEVSNHIDRKFDGDGDDYLVHYTNLVDQDTQLSEHNSFIRENRDNMQREKPNQPNGDINARPHNPPSSEPSFQYVQRPGASAATPPTGGASGYISRDALDELQPKELLAQVYLGNNSKGGRKLNGTASDNLSHNDMVPLQSPSTGYDGVMEDLTGGTRALPPTPQDTAIKLGPVEGLGGKTAPSYSNKTNSGPQSAGSAIPSYSKCALPDDGEAAQKVEEPIYQRVAGDEEPYEDTPAVTSPVPPPSASTAATAAGYQPVPGEGPEKGTAALDPGATDQEAPAGNYVGRIMAPAAQPHTVLAIVEKTSPQPSHGYVKSTQEPSGKGVSLPTSQVTPSLPDSGYAKQSMCTDNPASTETPPPTGMANSSLPVGYATCTHNPASNGALPPAQKATAFTDPGYSASTEDPSQKVSLPTAAGAAVGGGTYTGQGSSAVSPYCQLASQTDPGYLPHVGTEGVDIVKQCAEFLPHRGTESVDKVEQCAKPPAQLAASSLADARTGTSDYQQQIPPAPSVHDGYCSAMPPSNEGDTAIGGVDTPQNGQITTTTAQAPSGHVSFSPFSNTPAMPSLNVKNNNNGYVTVNM